MLKQKSAPIRTEPLLPADTRLGPVRIAVRQAESALPIWRDVLGLSVISQTPEEIRLGIGGRVLIVLEPGAEKPALQRAIGLYHVAIHVPRRIDLARFVVRAIEAGVRIAPTDHLVTEAVYIWDHDNNGIEITFETPWRGTLADPENNGGVYGITADGQPHSGREAIDLDDLLGELDADLAPRSPMPEGTRIGHVHVHVGDLDDAMHFYRDLIGFGGLFILRNWGMGDVGIGYMPHIVAFNIWAGPGAKLPPKGHAGLRDFVIEVRETAALEAMEKRLRDGGAEVSRDGDRLKTQDPSGNVVLVELQA